MKFNSKKLKELVDGSELKREAIASRCGLQTESLTKYLNGHGVPGPSALKLLTQVLCIPENDLWIKSENKKAS